MVLKTKRLLLRPFREDDAADVYAYAKDPRVGPMAGWNVHESMEDSLRYVRTAAASPEKFAVVDKATKRVIGSAGFIGGSQRAEDLADMDELGYALSPAYWGQGLMPEAVQVLLRHGFQNRKLASIWSSCLNGNTRSARVLEKCGFSYVMTLILKMGNDRECSTRLYVRLREEWEEKETENGWRTTVIGRLMDPERRS